MKHRYRITPKGRPPEPTDEEIAQFRDPKRLMYNYHRATRLMHRRPLYKDPKAFLALLLIVLLAWLLSGRPEEDGQEPPAPTSTEQLSL